MQGMRVLGGLVMLVVASCGSDATGDIKVTWTFASGDCSSNGVETIRVAWVPPNGIGQEASFLCSAGTGALGEAQSGTYSIRAEGLDASGVARVESYGSTVTINGSGTSLGTTADLTLQPKSSDVAVSWSIDGSPCPASVVLPFFITLYKAPTVAGGPHGNKVTEVQESCSTGNVLLTRVPPGDYEVELDSRAVTPLVKLSAPVTVKAGEPAELLLK